MRTRVALVVMALPALLAGRAASGGDAPWDEPVPPLQAAPAGAAASWDDPWAAPAVPQISEEGLVRYWPVLATLGFGGGWAFEGTTRTRAGALGIHPSGFLGLLRHWKIDHGPTFSLPLGMPALGYEVNAALVPGYQGIHRVTRGFLWGAGVSLPLLVAPEFLPGVEIGVMAAYRILAGLGAYARIAYDTFFCTGSPGCYSLTTFGGEVGVVLYYEWFRPWQGQAAAAEGAIAQ